MKGEFSNGTRCPACNQVAVNELTKGEFESVELRDDTTHCKYKPPSKTSGCYKYYIHI